MQGGIGNQDGIVNHGHNGQGFNHMHVGHPRVVQNVEQPPQQLLSLSAPLGAGISQQTRDKIVGGFYVEFSSLIVNDGVGEGWAIRWGIGCLG